MAVDLSRRIKKVTQKCLLPLVLTDVQRLVFDHPVDVRLGVAGGLTVKDGCVTLVHRCILRLHLKANVHCMCTNTHGHKHTRAH